MSLIRDRIKKNRNQLDLGLDNEAQKGRQRTINPDGSFNIRKISGEAVDFDPFHWLITTSWRNYWLAVFLFYGGVNAIFAVIFYVLGNGALSGVMPEDTWTNHFMKCFFFANETFTTVGYGDMHPMTHFTSWIASLEAFVGLMSFALATGTLYGRFSKPRPKIRFSPNAIIAPVGDLAGFQFMIANQHKSNIMDLEATVNFSWVDKSDGEGLRRYKGLNLELSKIAMFPLSWTVNHIIDEESPLFGMGPEDIVGKEVDVFITLRGFDETYSQTVYIRMSYGMHNIIYGAKFRRPFYIDKNGQTVIDLRKVGDYDTMLMPSPAAIEIEKHLEAIEQNEL